jgi:hypothetical protein
MAGTTEAKPILGVCANLAIRCTIDHAANVVAP